MYQIENEGMTIREALKELSRNGVNITANTFKRKIGEGVLPEGRQRGMIYSSESIHNLIEQERKSMAGRKRRMSIVKKSVSVDFIKVSPEQMPEMVPVLESAFTGSPNVERWQAWIKRNPDIAYMLKVGGQAVAVGLIVPLSQEKIDAILAEQVTPPTTPDEILLYVPGVSTNLYVRSVAVIATATHAQKRRWAAILVRGLRNVFIDLGARGVIINKIYSRSETSDGRRILQHMGFSEIHSVTNHSNYVIDAPVSGLKLIKAYNQAFTEWRQRQVGE